MKKIQSQADPFGLDANGITKYEPPAAPPAPDPITSKEPVMAPKLCKVCARLAPKKCKRHGGEPATGGQRIEASAARRGAERRHE